MHHLVKLMLSQWPTLSVVDGFLSTSGSPHHDVAQSYGIIPIPTGIAFWLRIIPWILVAASRLQYFSCSKLELPSGYELYSAMVNPAAKLRCYPYSTWNCLRLRVTPRIPIAAFGLQYISCSNLELPFGYELYSATANPAACNASIATHPNQQNRRYQ